MSPPRVRLDRLDIRLRGVPPRVAEAAATGLEAALGRRLRGWRPEAGRGVTELTLDPLPAVPGIDAETLRDLLVERIETGLRRALGEADGGGGE